MSLRLDLNFSFFTKYLYEASIVADNNPKTMYVGSAVKQFLTTSALKFSLNCNSLLFNQKKIR